MCSRIRTPIFTWSRMICISSASSLPSLSDQWFVIHQENSDFVATADLQTSALIHSGPSLSQVAFFSGNRRENVVRFPIEPESSRASENKCYDRWSPLCPVSKQCPTIRQVSVPALRLALVTARERLPGFSGSLRALPGRL